MAEHQNSFLKTKVKTRIPIVTCDIISVDTGKPIMLITNCQIDFPYPKDVLLEIIRNAIETEC